MVAPDTVPPDATLRRPKRAGQADIPQTSQEEASRVLLRKGAHEMGTARLYAATHHPVTGTAL